jgi:hypothetical protein
MTTTEQTRMREVEQALNQGRAVLEEMGIEPQFVSIIFGSMMAAVDATFAIRDGGEWRGLTDPKEIAAKLLADAQLAD